MGASDLMAEERVPSNSKEGVILSRGMSSLQDYAYKMLDKAFRLANEALGHPPTVAQLVQTAARIEESMDIQVHRFSGKLEVLHQQGKSSEIACAKGCAYCCKVKITASVPEVLRLALWLKENKTEQELAALRKRLAAYNSELAALKASGLPRPPMNCAVLVDNACSAYPGRPVACRAANSVDVGACAQACENWRDESLTIPYVGQPIFAGKEMVKGIKMALEQRGISSPTVELSIALEIALDDPEAGERFLAGEPIFEPAAV